MNSCVSFHSVALTVACALAGSVHAQDGAYDSSFGNGGRAWIDVTSSISDYGTKLIRLPNGIFFMAGACDSHSCAAWLTPSGSLATGYGTSGTGTASFTDFPGWSPNDDGGVDDAASFADGRVVLVVLFSTGHLAVLRADGTGLDAAVGNGAGYVAPPFYPQLVRVTPQQKVIVVGYDKASPRVIVAARYDSTLHLDTSFGNGGSTTIGFPNEGTYAAGMTMQKDGKIVVVASVGVSPSAVGIVRLTADGSPDPDFGINSDGRFKSTFGNTYDLRPHDIVVDKQGRLVFVGGVASNSGVDGGKWFVNRLLSGGATDTTFNGGLPQQFTIFSTSQNYSPEAVGVAVQNDGQIAVAGTVDRPNDLAKYFALARFTDTGAFDSSYGIGGQSYGDMSPQPDSTTDVPQSMVIVPGGILIGGSTEVTGGEVRFSATKVLIDPLFASDFE